MITDFKTLLINIGAFGISMTNIDIALKILLSNCYNRIYSTKVVLTK